MNTILKQVIVLVMLVTLFDKLLPDGKMKQAGKTGLGLVMLLMLVTFLSNALHFTAPDENRAAKDIFQNQPLPARGSYRDAALESGQRQLSLYAQKAAERAGFEGVLVTVALEESGSIKACYVSPDSREASSLASDGVPQTLKAALALALQITEDKIFAFREEQGGHGV